MEPSPHPSQGGSESESGHTPGFAVPLTCHRTRITADLSSVPTARANFASFLVASGVPDDDRPHWELAFTEAVTNAIRHGALEDPYLHVTLEWWAEDAELCLAIT
ncbi:ATP-binding protein, partial [Verrucomicrobiales bacterium]|nr:ATP-binding protein [Verrucomicrobiales bacterium]